MKIVPLVDVKARLSSYVDAIQSDREPVIITRHGKPAAMLVPIDEEAIERKMLANSPRFREMVAEALEAYRAGNAISEDEFWAEVLGDTLEEPPQPVEPDAS